MNKIFQGQKQAMLSDTEMLLNSDVSKVADVLSSLAETDASPCGTSAVDTQGIPNTYGLYFI